MEQKFKVILENGVAKKIAIKQVSGGFLSNSKKYKIYEVGWHGGYIGEVRNIDEISMVISSHYGSGIRKMIQI